MAFVKKTLIGGVGLLILVELIVLYSGCRHNVNLWRLTSSDRQIERMFAKAPVKPSIFYFEGGGRRMRGWAIGADSLPVTLLLHGAPSSMTVFERWFRDSLLYNHARLVAVDRPGYGYSGYGRVEASIDKQAEVLEGLVCSLSTNRPITVFGTSFGGPVAARIAMRQPDCVGSLVLNSAAVQPGAERIPRIAYWVRSPLGILAPGWGKVSTKEKFTHRRSLEAIQDGWRNIRCPVWILHGEADDLIYPSNADYAYGRLIDHTPVRQVCFAGVNHYLYFQYPDTVRHYLLEAVRRN